MTDRPVLHSPDPEAEAAVAALIDHLQQGLDDGDADRYDETFAADVLWGTPYGQTVAGGFAELNAAHRGMMNRPATLPSRYELVHLAVAAPDTVLAQVRRRSLVQNETVPFDEMALYVLVRRGSRWWLAGGQNTPVRPKP